MKCLFYLCAFVLVGLALGDTKLRSRGCIYALGRCVRECEEGTHGYAVGCDFITPEPTCEEPKPVKDTRAGLICDFSACYCDPPTVRDTKTKKCVPLEECPQN
ncbi:uncharacterized protein LOC113510237 [Galleria mellonella]|uniref:Uncharacterized protein LOC113510237 n=1 Tax=Galleria mellonella TaxID=7137 RepID=A0A6J1WFT8_GALME|nr:uncharacterized protein LOC113510237 [Galleria mellonella]